MDQPSAEKIKGTNGGYRRKSGTQNPRSLEIDINFDRKFSIRGLTLDDRKAIKRNESV